MRRELLVAAAILMDKQGRVLLVANDWSRRGRVRYTLPGGTVEAGETLIDALKRDYDGLLNPRDPDGHIVEARFFTPQEVAAKLEEHRPLREPLLDYLKGERGRFYAYGSWGGRASGFEP
ncbi:MAG: NUDIX hydrolase [Meiothermus silvanus]|nr:NUDIX hydrolase [Allomeiothermus silvanus]